MWGWGGEYWVGAGLLLSDEERGDWYLTVACVVAFVMGGVGGRAGG